MTLDSKIVSNLPDVPVFEPELSSGQKFIENVNSVLSLANSGGLALQSNANNSGMSLSDYVKNDDKMSNYQKDKLVTNLLSQTPTSVTPVSVSYGEVKPYALSRDFEKLGYTPLSDNEQRYIDNRSLGNTLTKIGEKFGVNAGVGAASVVTPITWLGDKLFDTKTSESLAGTLAEWQKASEEKNKIFYSQAEMDRSPFNPLTTRFWDGLLPSVGFTVGNIAATFVAAELGAIGLASLGRISGAIQETAMFNKLKAITSLGEVKTAAYNEIKVLDDIATKTILQTAAEQKAAIEAATKPFALVNNFIVKTLPYSIYSGAAEGHVEAALARQEFVENSIAKYKEENGSIPDAETMVQIEKDAGDVYDKTLIWNTGVLSITNTLEIGSLLTKFGIAGKLMGTRLSTIPGISRLGKAVHFDEIFYNRGITAWEKKNWKQLALPYSVASLIEGFGEGLEEGLQYRISTGVQEWANRKYDNPSAENLKRSAFSYIFNKGKTFNEEEYIQNYGFGAISGALFGAGARVIVNPAMQKIKKEGDVAQKRVDLLNKGEELIRNGLMGNNIEANENKIANYTQTLEIARKALKEGNIYALENLHDDNLFSWVLNSIKAGGYNLRVEQLKDLKKLEGDQFKEYFKLDYNEDNKKLVSDYLDSIVDEGKLIANDIEAFSNIKNIFTYTDKPEDELTEDQKKQNLRYQNFEVIRDESAYRYFKMRTLEKRIGNLIGEVETQFGSTELVNNLKNVLFNPQGFKLYENKIKQEIETLKAELETYQEGGKIFREDYIRKQQEIADRERVLKNLNATKEDVKKYIDDEVVRGLELSEDEKTNLINRANVIADTHFLNTLINFELSKIEREKLRFNQSFDINYNGQKLTSRSEIVSALSQNVYDIYAASRSKNIVIDAFNNLNTKEGITKFIDDYIAKKEAFENGTSAAEFERYQSEKSQKALREIREEYNKKGYPKTVTIVQKDKNGNETKVEIPRNSVGVRMKRFISSGIKAKNDPKYTQAIEEAKDKAKSLIKETKVKVKDKKGDFVKDNQGNIQEKTQFTTVFENVLASEIQGQGIPELIVIQGDTKESVEKQIEALSSAMQEEEIMTTSEEVYTLKGVSSVEKTKEGKFVESLKYVFINDDGVTLTKGTTKETKYSSEEIKNLISGIKNYADPSIISIEVMPYSEFETLEKKTKELIYSKSKLQKAKLALKQNGEKVSELEKLLQDPEFAARISNPFVDEIQKHYSRIFGFQNTLKELDNRVKEIKNLQLQFSRAYVNKVGTGNKGWASTRENREYISQLKTIQSEIESVNQSLNESKEQLEKFQKDNAKTIDFYTNYREALMSLEELTRERQILQTYIGKIVENIVELRNNKTLQAFRGSIELDQLNANFEKSLDEFQNPEKVKERKEALDSLLDKEIKLRELNEIYSTAIKQHEKRIKENEESIQELNDEIEYLNYRYNVTIPGDINLSEKKILKQIKLIEDRILDYQRRSELEKKAVEDLQAKIRANYELMDKNLNLSGFSRSIADEYQLILGMTKAINAINKATIYQDVKDTYEGINNRGAANYWKLQSQRNFVHSPNGDIIVLEHEPDKFVITQEDAYKPNNHYQSPAIDINDTNILGRNEDGTVIIPSKEEIDGIPQIEYNRFLSENSPQDIAKNYKVMVVTPAFIKAQASDNKLFADLLDHIQSQFDDLNKINETTDLFTVIVDKNTLQPIKRNGKFLTGSLFKPQNKYAVNEKGIPLHITEKRLLSSFKMSDQYAKDIKDMTEEQIEDYLKSPATLSKALNYARESYQNQLNKIIESVNSGKVVTLEIEDVTTGIFYKGKQENEVKKVMGITKENANEFAIGVVKEGDKTTGGAISYIDADGSMNTIAANIPLGTTVVINRKTGQWIPLQHKKQNPDSIDNILGMIYLATQMTKSGKAGFLDEIQRGIPYGENFQLFATSADSRTKVEEIPLFPKVNREIKTRKENTYLTSRWSVITTLVNWTQDRNKPKNSIYFSPKGDLNFYSFEDEAIVTIPFDELNNILGQYFEDKKALSESDQKIMAKLVGHLQQKYRNISYQYALSTTNEDGHTAFYLPKYNAKTKKIEFKYFSSYLAYVLGLEGTSPIVTTNIVRMDGRTSFQKSLIFKSSTDGLSLITKEESKVPTSVKTEKAAESKPVNTTKNDKNIADLKEESFEIKPNEIIIGFKNNLVLSGKNVNEEPESMKFMMAITSDQVQNNKELKSTFDKIVDNIEKIKASKDEFEKNILRNENKTLFQILIYKTKGLNLANNDLFKKHQTERAEFNKTAKGKLVEGAIVEIDGIGFKVSSFQNKLHGELVTLTPIEEGENTRMISSNLIIEGINNGKFKIADNQEVGTKKEVAESKLNELKDLIAKTEDLIPIMDDIFKVLDENKYIEWQNKFDKEQIEKDLKTQLESAKSENEVANILTKYLLPKFIDAELAALEKGKPTPTAEKSIEEMFNELQENGIIKGYSTYSEYKSVVGEIASIEEIEDDIKSQYRQIKPKDSLQDLTLDKIEKDNNINKVCDGV